MYGASGDASDAALRAVLAAMHVDAGARLKSKRQSRATIRAPRADFARRSRSANRGARRRIRIQLPAALTGLFPLANALPKRAGASITAASICATSCYRNVRRRRRGKEGRA
jgi:hypothetical protein